VLVGRACGSGGLPGRSLLLDQLLCGTCVSGGLCRAAGPSTASLLRGPGGVRQSPHAFDRGSQSSVLFSVRTSGPSPARPPRQGDGGSARLRGPLVSAGWGA